MRRQIFGIALVVVIAFGAQLSADDAAPTLPKDGTWVRYFVTGKTSQQADEVKWRTTYSLVGTKMENGQKCRWVEKKQAQDNGGVDQIEIIKFLIPEKELLESKAPMKSLVRAWRSINNGAVDDLFGATASSSLSDADFHYGSDLIIFPGPQRGGKIVHEPTVVEYQSGRLEMATGRETHHVASRSFPSGTTLSAVTDVTLWTHPTVPLGWAQAKIRFEFRRNDKPGPNSLCDWLLEDFGADAKTALPDND